MDSGLPLGASRAMEWSVGVFDDEGRLRGSVALDCDMRHARFLLDRFRVGGEGRAFLLDEQNREVLSERTPFEDSLEAEARLPGTPWRVRLNARKKEFLSPLRRVQRWTALLSLTCSALILLWIGYWIREAARPIEAMAEATERIAAGDLDFRFIAPDIRELRTLGEAFNEMTKSLKQRNRELEARIRELTALREMEGAVLERLDEETVLRTCLQAVAKGLSFERVGLYWVEPERNEIAHLVRP